MCTSVAESVTDTVLILDPRAASSIKLGDPEIHSFFGSMIVFRRYFMMKALTPTMPYTYLCKGIHNRRTLAYRHTSGGVISDLNNIRR